MTQKDLTARDHTVSIQNFFRIRIVLRNHFIS